jgi:peptide/nickel transport system substrate-binding protein
MKKRILWSFVSLVLISCLQLSACSSKAPTTSGKFLTINHEQVSTWVRNFNPFSATPLGPTNTAIYEPMMIYNKATGQMVPWLATEFSWNTDNTVLTFKIRPNVKWSDGQAFTAKDVAYTFNLLKNNDTLVGTATSILKEYITDIATPDDSTIAFTFNSVYTPALYDLANQPIVPEHIWKDVADPLTFTNENPVATGPFTQVTKFESQIYILEKNPYYWQEGKPAFQGLRYPAFADNDAANLAMANGEIDWAGNFVPDIEKTFVAKDPENYHYYFVGGDCVSLSINTSIKPFDNADVRKAVSMGIDRAMIIQTAEYNYIPASDATGLSDSYNAWKDPAAVAAGTWTNYNVATANEMLDAAGLTRGSDGIRVDQDGKPMHYTLIVPAGWTDWISAAQIISQNMNDLGITVDVQTPEETTWTDTATKGQFEWTLAYHAGGPTPYNFYRDVMSQLSVVPVGQNANWNWARFVSPEADVLLDQFSKISDPAQQKELMNQIEALFVELAPTIPLFPGPDWDEYSTKNFTGFPNKENPYAAGAPFPFSPYNTPLIVLTTITPK